MITLRPYQEKAVAALLAHNRGIVKAPAGSGKTILVAAAVQALDRPASFKLLWVANTIEQCQQAEAALKAVGFPSVQIGSVCCYQSGEKAEGYDLVVLDECHHIASPEFRKILDGYNGPRWGITATPDRADDLMDDVYTLIGPIVYEVDRNELLDTGKLAPAKVYFHAPNAKDEMTEAVETGAAARLDKMRNAIAFTATKMKNQSIESVARILGGDDHTALLLFAEKKRIDSALPYRALLEVAGANRANAQAALRYAAEKELLSRARWHACLATAIAENEKRNAKIVELAVSHREDSVLILVGSIDHGKFLKTQIPGSEVLYSKMGAKKRAAAMEAFRDGTLKCAIATSLADEGLDVPRANVLILAAAGRSAAKAEQRTGRVLRSWSDKSHGTIHDFWDWQVPLLLNQSKARAKTYAGLDYEFCETTEGILPAVLKGVGIKVHPALPLVVKVKRKSSGKSTIKTLEQRAEPATAAPLLFEAHSSAPESSSGAAQAGSAGEENFSAKTSCVVASTPLPSRPVSDSVPVLVHAERAHAKLSPSKLKYKAVCPGYESDETSDKSFADRGSLGHLMVEKEDLSLGKDDTGLVSAAKKCIAYQKQVIKSFRDRVVGTKVAVKVLQEVKLRYFDQWGFCDTLILAGTRAGLIDWKFAYNWYDADAPQFHAYCIGVWDKYPEIEEIEVHVPHPFRDEIDLATFTRKEHYARFAGEIAAIIQRAKKNDPAHYQISQQCNYCGFAAKCSKLARVGDELAKRYCPEPIELPEGSMHGSEITDPVAIATLHRLAPIVEKAAGGWKKRALELWDEGVAIPGYEMSHRAGRRSIASSKAAFDIVKDRLSLEQYLEACSTSPTQLEELYAATFPRGEKGHSKENLENMLVDADLLTSGEGYRFLRPIKK